MDSWTTDILKQLEMPEHVINKFIEEEIDKITFLALTESMLKELVPKLKLRAILYSKIVELKEEKCTVHLNDTNVAPNKDEEFINLINPINTIDMIHDITNFEIMNEKEMDGTVIDNSLVLSSDEFLIQDIPSCNNRIKLILEQSQEGKNVLKFYHSSNNFSYAVRNKLVRLIIDYEVTHSPDQKLSMNHLLQLSQSIVQIFPNESESTYFIPYLKSKEYVRPTRGKLFDRYCNLTKDIRKLNVSPSTTTGECSSNTPVTAFNQDLNDSILWLKNNRESMDIVVNKWTETFSLRYDQMLKSNKQLNYFLEYPAISGPLGYKLIEIDFNILQPEKQLKLFDLFPILIECLPKYIKHFKPQLNKEASYQRFLNIIPTENRQEITVAILTYLPRIFPCVTICVPKTRIVDNNKRAKTFDSWRPSNREISEGFICIIKNAIVFENCLS
eukprot:XP_016656050.1 PREDICTED: uncharacterized protein LOC100574931 isoform X2 [Acyrthosiphon pisum]